MNEIAIRDSSRDVDLAADYRNNAVQRLGEWAQSAAAAHEVATNLVQTSFVPEAFRNKPAEATAAILAGSEVGLSPMASLRSFDIIQGTAAPRALTLRAVVQSFGHTINVEESTATRCVVRAKRRGESEWQRVVWTMDRAKQLGLVNKHNWKAQPQAMLVARATSEACRLVAADAILGVGYAAEEVEDGVDPTVEPLAPMADAPPAASSGGTRRMSRKKKAAEPAPVPDSDEATSPAGSEPKPLVITDAQMKMLHASFSDLGITERDDRLQYTAKVVDRPVESSKDLTKDEASQVIDALQSDLETAFEGPGS